MNADLRAAMRIPIIFLTLLHLALGKPASVFVAQHLTRSGSLEDSYDYVVVGGGTSGLTVADRLTEDGKFTVLVVEYGSFEDYPSQPYDPAHPPSGVPPRLMYNITSVGTQKVSVGAGCCVGGSSAVNSQIFMRGTSEDYDRWQTLGGPDSDWNWQGLLPYFKKSATFTPPDQQLAEDFDLTYDIEKDWGTHGPIFASWPSFLYPGIKIMRDAWKGVPGVDFPRDGCDGQAGIVWVPISMDPKNATRSYARTGHYNRVAGRPNYSILTAHKVVKINFSAHERLTATSVSIVPRYGNASAVTISARKEIVLAAGAIHSPQILQLSGIGPQSVLDAAKIPQILELPGVGQNFHDQPYYSHQFKFQTNVLPNPTLLATNTSFATWAAEVWAANSTGPYSGISGPNLIALLGLPVIAPDAYESIASEIESQDPASFLPNGTDRTVIAGYGAQLSLMARAVRSKNTAFLQLPLRAAENFYVFNTHPLSRGTINLNPVDPSGEPLVDYRSLSNPIDLRVLLVSLKAVRGYFRQPGLQQLLPVEIVPGPEVETDEQITEWLKAKFGASSYHPVGTCAMMPVERGGVVDEGLRVHGMRGLSVVDASVMPMVIGATTQATVYAVAEKAADLIKGRA